MNQFGCNNQKKKKGKEKENLSKEKRQKKI